MDDNMGINGVDRKRVDDAPSQNGQIKKDRSEVSDESDSNDSDSDSEMNDTGEDGSQNYLSYSSDDDDDDMDEEDSTNDWEDREDLVRYHKKLTRCTLMYVNRECLILDPGAGFYLIDGDSLMLEAMDTKSWKYGQQLHLFYLVEIYLYQLRQNGGGTFEIVFFKEMEKIWYHDVVLRVLREALIVHLTANCNINVHCKWKDPFCDEWLEYLNTENPSFIFIHDGRKKCMSTNTALKVLTYTCLSHYLGVAFTSGIQQQSSKLYAVFVKSLASHSASNNKTYLQEAWTSLFDFLDTKFVHVSEVEEASEVIILKNKLFLESITCYWRGLTGDEKESSSGKHVLNRWCRYFAVLASCTLSERITLVRETKSDNCKYNLTPGSALYKFVFCVLRSLHGVYDTLSSYVDPESVADILDLAVHSQLFESDTVCAILSSKEIEARYLALHELANSKGISFETDHIITSEQSLDSTTSEDESALIAVESRLAIEYAGEVNSKLNIAERGTLGIDEDEDEDDFDDNYSWKTQEPLKDDVDHHAQKSLSKIPYIRSRQLKEIQKYNDFIAMYGKSLENTIEPTMITKNENKENKKTEKVQQKQKPKKQASKKNMRETIIEENKKKILEENKKRVATQWKSKKGEIDEMIQLSPLSVDLAIKKVSDFIRKYESSKLGYEEPIIFLMQLQYDRWKQSCVDNNINIPYVAEFVHTMHGILQSQNSLSDNLKVKISRYFRRIGFEDVASHITQMLPEGKQSMLKIAEKSPVDMPYNVFQMKFMGHLMKRQERSDPDPRVTGFIPDTWQRELLDVVDKNESAVIVAPTSSGKTFCSFYCMEKVLRESDTNVVVYVSPTKALVNQVQASIYARYKKNMPAGMSVVGVFTRDYQHNALTSQILVTVPQCLEILLLSPKRQQWTSRLSYVIFDEVHCIGGEHGGVVWEHLITLIRCPFLALSATIGNPEFFHSWLRYVNKFKEMQCDSEGQKTAKNKVNMKYSVKLVVHNERYSDINKNIYFPQSDEIVETHPCIFLDAHPLSASGFPSAFSLSPRETYDLWLAGKFAFNDDPDKLNTLEKWCPVKHFGDQLYITKQQAREYEISLKKQLAEMVKGNLSKAQLLITYFREKLPADCIAKNSYKGFNILGISEVEFDICKKFPPLIERLRKEDKLPVIVFMNNRHGIEMLAKSLTEHVREKIEDVHRKVHGKQLEGDKVTKKPAKHKKNRDSDGDEVEDHIGIHLQGEMSKQKLQIQKKENACKFITQGTLSSEDREKVIGRLKDASMLEYGIGYHHSGCNVKHKRAVEILFRSQYAQVALATATLALGIHMPCKTVVFVGDDHYVDALNYRQMSGRSGRRGFDNLGNVIFFGVPLPKISKLIKADISKLAGQFPVNCTIVMRLLLLVAQCNDLDDAHKKAMTVLSHPFITHQSPSLQDQLKYYFLFVTDFLIRQNLIDEKGVPLGFSGLVSHIHYHEPGNMVFVNLLKKGIFHAICEPSKATKPINFGFACKKCNAEPIVGNRFTCTKCLYDYTICSKCFGTSAFHRVRRDEHQKSDFQEHDANLKYTYPEDTLRLLLCILCHIFGVKELPSIRLKLRADKSCVLRKKPKFASKVILDPMPDNAHRAVCAYNQSVQSIFGNYLRVVSKTLPKDEQATLPISKKSWKVCSDKNHYTLNDDATGVDPFVQLSGCSNLDVKSYCLDTEEIRRILPRQIYMDFNFIPSLSIGGPKNAYALDFFKHSSKKAIAMDNWLPIGEVYDSLNDFRLLIGTISTALEQLGPEDSNDHVVWAFRHLEFEYTHRFNLAYPERKKKK